MDTLTGGNGATAASLGYRLFDADNHYYEPEDAFLRYLDPKLAHKAPRWVQMDDGARRLIFGDRMNRFVGADHTFKQVGKAGVLQQGEAGNRRRSRVRISRRRTRTTASETPAWRSWTARVSRRASSSPRSQSAWRRSSSMTSKRPTPTCTPSTSGSTTTGASTTRTASTASRCSPCSTRSAPSTSSSSS